MPKTFSLRTLLLSAGVLMSLLAGPAPAADATAQAAFDRGLEASRSGDDRAAVAAFVQARRAGLNSPALHYNLGVSYFRLRDDSAAEREFRQLLEFADWAPLAHYNLGLIARRRGEIAEARSHFLSTQRTAENPKLLALAARALGRLPGADRTAATRLSVSVAGGYDSNVALAPDAETVGLTDDSDSFAELSGLLVHQLNPGEREARHVYGGVYLRRYADFTEFDQDTFRLGLIQNRFRGAWEFDLSTYLDSTHVDSELFENAASVAVRARRPLSADSDLELRYQASLIDAGTGYAYLEGWQQRAGLVGLWSAGPGRLELGYELELNDRDDLAQNGEFFSYSPTRHTAFVSLADVDLGEWRYRIDGAYRYSRYEDPYRIIDGTTVEVLREDHRYEISLRGERRLSRSWRLFFDYDYADNASEISVYEYTRHEIKAGLEVIL